MTQDTALTPWARYSRLRVHAGWSYPLGQTDVRSALEAAATSIGEVVFFHFPDAKSRTAAERGTMDLVSAKWDGMTSGLWLYAVPASYRQAARVALLSDALPRAIDWLRLLPRRGNAWEATRHDWKATLDSGTVRVAEVDAEHPPAGSGVGSWPGYE